MSAEALAPGSTARELLRSSAWLVVVVVVAAGMLAGLDAVPAWVNGESRDVRVVRTLEEAERRVRARLILPAYFPDTIAWPPQKIRVLPGQPPAVALQLTARGGGEPRMLLAQSLGSGEIPDRVLPPAGALDETAVAIAGTQGKLRRIVGPDGAVWREVEWAQGGRTVVLRSKGTLEELLRMARSARVQP